MTQSVQHSARTYSEGIEQHLKLPRELLSLDMDLGVQSFQGLVVFWIRVSGEKLSAYGATNQFEICPALQSRYQDGYKYGGLVARTKGLVGLYVAGEILVCRFNGRPE